MFYIITPTYIQGGARNVIPLIVHVTHFYYYKNIFWPPLEDREARKCSAAQGPHNEVVPRAFWRLVSKSFDECKSSFARSCEAKRWSHWTFSSLGTIFQPMRINSVPGVKWFCNNKNVLHAQSMVWHFVRHPVFRLSLFELSLSYIIIYLRRGYVQLGILLLSVVRSHITYLKYCD